MKTKIYKLFSCARQKFSEACAHSGSVILRMTALGEAVRGKYVALVLTVFSGTVYAQTTYTFNYTGSSQTVSLPAGTYSIACWGADGGTVAANTATPGRGGYSSGDITLSTPTTFSIYVGGKGNGGAQPLGGFNSGNSTTKTNVTTATGGGGASDVRVLTDNFLNRIIVAGGGGGQGTGTGFGGHGGGLTGQNGQGTTNPGVPGTQTAPGLYPPGGDAKPATFGEGGDGPAGTTGGQGGGGWYGGSFGTRTNGGGAGGSGYVLTSTSFSPAGYFVANPSYYFTNTVTAMPGTIGFVSNPDVTGNGRVYITGLCGISLVASGSNSLNPSICIGQSLTLSTNAISNYTWSNSSNASSIIVSPAVTTTYSLTAMSPSLCMASAAITVTVSSATPVLSLTVSSPSVCLGNTVSIGASGALTYTFSGGISNGIPFSPIATTAYTIFGQNGCGTSNSVTTIAIAPLPVTGVASPTLVCAGSTSTLTGSGATTYTWLPGPVVSTAVIVSLGANTIYTVIGGTGNCIGTNTISLMVNPIPTLVASASNSLPCQGETVTLTATGALNFTWQPGNLIGSSVVVSPMVPTAFVVTGNNSFGCTASAQQPVVVFASPTVMISSSASTICAGNSVSIFANGADTYLWNTGAITSNIVVSPPTNTVYSVVGTNTVNQCTDTKTIQINVFTPNLTVTSPTAICIGESITLIANGASLYQWSNGGSGSNIVVNPTSTTSYTVNGIHSVGGGTCGSVAITQVTVNPLPTVIAASTRTSICKNESTNITASGASNYMWSHSAGTSSLVTVSPTINTTYTVEGTDGNGCKNTASIFIRVNNCTGLNEHSSSVSSLLVFPNPNNGRFNIQSTTAMELLLVNELGQTLMELHLDANNNYSVEVKNLATGLYFINAKDPNLNLNKKLIVQH